MYVFHEFLDYNASQIEGCPAQAVPYYDCCIASYVLWMYRLSGIPPHFIVQLCYYVFCHFGQYIVFDLI